MKWFTATNENSLENDKFYAQLLVAVRSAKEHTTLTPFLVYDGRETVRLSELEKLGVNVLFHNLSIKPQLREYMLAHYDQELYNVRSGAHLRGEIPKVLERYGIIDKFILYTDADVLFTRECNFNHLNPKFFSAVGHRVGGRTKLKLGSWVHYNSGVLVMNVPAMRLEYSSYREFLLANGNGLKRPNDKLMQKNLFLSDQAALNLYYRNRINKLSENFNWNPSRGVNEQAAIIHFNGLKWTQWDDFLQSRLRPDRQEKFTRLVNRSRDGYEYYVQLARSFL